MSPELDGFDFTEFSRITNPTILITGSRSWTDLKRLQEALLDFDEFHHPPQNTITMVSGHAHEGADVMCERMAKYLNWGLRLYPAEWEKYGRRAGFVRNAEMVIAGANVCLAFIHNESKGATMTADLAQKAHIPTIIFEA